ERAAARAGAPGVPGDRWLDVAAGAQPVARGAAALPRARPGAVPVPADASVWPRRGAAVGLERCLLRDLRPGAAGIAAVGGRGPAAGRPADVGRHGPVLPGRLGGG